MRQALAADVIASQFPELSPARVVHLGAGYDSDAFDVNGRWVFRFPKRPEVERQLAIERRILPALASSLPLAVPRFEFHGRPSALFGRSFCGYPKLPGEPAIRLALEPRALEAVAGPLARFLQALHGFPVTTARGLGVPDEPVDQVIGEIRDDALADLGRVEAVDPDAPIDRWRNFLEQGVELSNRCAPVLIHNDFAAEHLLVDAQTRTISGVIDWSDVAIGDPAADFAGLFHWGGEALAVAVAAAYGGSLDAAALIRARYLGACRGAMDVAFGLDEGRREYVAAGLRALRLCAGE